MLSYPYHFVLITRGLENFSVVSVLAFTLPTPGRGALAVTKDHKKISCLMGPYNTETGNHYIYNHDLNLAIGLFGMCFVLTFYLAML
jgi:hypothetical protein